MTAHFKFYLFVRMCYSRVVLPAPRNPDSIVRGNLTSSDCILDFYSSICCKLVFVSSISIGFSSFSDLEEAFLARTYFFDAALVFSVSFLSVFPVAFFFWASFFYGFGALFTAAESLKQSLTLSSFPAVTSLLTAALIRATVASPFLVCTHLDMERSDDPPRSSRASIAFKIS